MIQLTATICLFVSSYVFHRIHASLCCLLLTAAVYTTLNTPLNLAVMTVECYIAVCLPLRHARFCTVKRTYILIGWIWVMSSVSTLPDIFFTLSSETVRVLHSNIFCSREELFRHPVLVQKQDVSYILYLFGVWATLFFTYFKIFFTARAAKQTKCSDGNTSKARNTILLHGFQLMMSMLTFIYQHVNKALFSLFPKNYIQILFVWYISVQIFPRFISPVVYGLRDQTFRQHLKKYLACILRAGVRPCTTTKLLLIC